MGACDIGEGEPVPPVVQPTDKKQANSSQHAIFENAFISPSE